MEILFVAQKITNYVLVFRLRFYLPTARHPQISLKKKKLYWYRISTNFFNLRGFKGEYVL